MAKQNDACVGGVIKKVSEVPICIGGVIKEAKKGVCCVGGVIKEFFQSCFTIYDYGEGYSFTTRSTKYGTVNSDHLYVSEASSWVEEGYARFTTSETLDLTTLDDFSVIKMYAASEKSSKTYHNVFFQFYFGSTSRYVNMYDAVTIDTGGSTIEFSISDANKTKFNSYYATYGAPTFAITVYEDYQEWEEDGTDEYSRAPLLIYQVTLE